MSQGEVETLRRITSGEMAEEFARSVDDEAAKTGLPPALLMIKKLVARVVENGPEPKPEPEKSEEEKQRETFIEKTRFALDKRRKQLRRQKEEAESDEPQGQVKSRAILNIKMLSIDAISEDSDFINTRLDEDVLNPDWSSTEGQRMEDLRTSMDAEGLKVPLLVVPAPKKNHYYLRAGFRRTKCARELGWVKIPAIVLESVDGADDYWANLLENSTRKSLRTYEVARAAKLMKDKFGVTATEFASRTGYSVGYVCALMGCIDRLPDELLEQWKMGARLTFEEWQKLSLLEPQNAIRYFRRWTGQSTEDLMREFGEKRARRKLAPAQWLDRMQRLYIGIEGSELEPKQRDLCLKVVEFCMGQINGIPGVYDPRRKGDYERRARLRSELKLPALPDPGENREMPTPQDADEDDVD